MILEERQRHVLLTTAANLEDQARRALTSFVHGIQHLLVGPTTSDEALCSVLHPHIVHRDKDTIGQRSVESYTYMAYDPPAHPHFIIIIVQDYQTQVAGLLHII